VIVELISAATTKTGLTVYCELDTGQYPRGIVVSDAEMAAINIKRAEFHGDWNYTISPNTYPQIARLFADGLLGHKITKYHSRIAPAEKWIVALATCVPRRSHLEINVPADVPTRFDRFRIRDCLPPEMRSRVLSRSARSERQEPG
jgi:hypothetical protein